MQLTTISGKSPLAAAIRYALTRMDRLRPYLDHGILELDNNAAERGMRAIALGRKNYLFVGSEAGGKAAAIAYTLIETAKLNAVDPHAWLADTLARIPDYKITKVDDLLPWHWNRVAVRPDGYRPAALALGPIAVRPDAYRGVTPDAVFTAQVRGRDRHRTADLCVGEKPAFIACAPGQDRDI
jgi:hypothetical protein